MRRVRWKVYPPPARQALVSIFSGETSECLLSNREGGGGTRTACEDVVSLFICFANP